MTDNTDATTPGPAQSQALPYSTIESDAGRVMTWGAELHAAAKASDWPHVGYLAAAIATVNARVANAAEQAEHV